MASAIYPITKAAILGGTIDFDTDDIRIIAVDTADYTYSSAHDFLSDVAAGARVATSGAITGVTLTTGIFKHNAVTFTTVTGDPFEALIYYKHTGVEATSPLICYIDSATNLPMTPDGSNIVWTPDATNGVFTL